jgi:GntR family transcriptional regulator
MRLVTIDSLDPRPPYRQIADQLRTAIYEREFPPGAQLPSERDLVLRFGTAPQTVRQALNVLKSEGLVIGRPGRGVFVREKPPLIHRLHAARRFVTEAREQGRSADVRLLGVETTSPAPEVAERLNLDTDAQVVVRRYLLLVDDDPFQLSESHFPAHLAKGTALASPENVTPGAIDRDLIDRHGLAAARYVDELTVRMPLTDEVRALRLLPGTPVAMVLRTYLDASGTPFEIARYIVPGDRATLVHEGRLTKPKRRAR